MVWGAVGNFLGRIGGAIAPKLASEGFSVLGRTVAPELAAKLIGAAGIAGTAYAGSVLFGGDSQPPYAGAGGWRGQQYPAYPMPYGGFA